jgi:hypothetical protein
VPRSMRKTEPSQPRRGARSTRHRSLGAPPISTGFNLAARLVRPQTEAEAVTVRDGNGVAHQSSFFR